MNGTDDYLPNGARRCKATSKQTGNRCRNAVIPGAETCRFHGSANAVSRRAARLRLLELVDPAITTMAAIMDDPKASEQARIRAAENILDRAGYPRAVQVDADSAKDLLMVRLLELRDQALAEREQVVGKAREIVEGHVIDEVGGDGETQTRQEQPRKPGRSGEQGATHTDIPPRPPKAAEDETATQDGDDQENP